MPKAIRGSDALLFVFGFALMAAFWPGIAGAATTPRWIVAGLLGFAWFAMPRSPWTMSAAIGLALLGWLLASLSWSAGALDGVDTTLKLGLAVIAFAVGLHVADLRPLFVGAAVGLAISSAVAVAQAFGWHGIPSIDDAPAGLFANRGRLGSAAALVIVGLIALRVWSLPLIAAVLPGLVLANNRAALLGAGIGFCFIAAPRPVRMIRLAYLAAFAVGLLALRGIDTSASERLWIWRDTLSGLTFWGHGLGSFRELYPTYLDAFAQSWALTRAPTRPEHPHNELLWLLFEGGIPAILLAGAFGFALWRASSHELRAVLACLFVLGQFAMPLHDPATLIMGAVVAGFLAGSGALSARLSCPCRDPLCAGVAAFERGVVSRRDGSCGQALPVSGAVSRRAADAAEGVCGNGGVTHAIERI